MGPAWTERGRPGQGIYTRQTAKAYLDPVLAEARRGELPGMVRSGATFADAVDDHAGADLRPKTWMGHADIDTTMKYLHYARRDAEANLVADASRRNRHSKRSYGPRSSDAPRRPCVG